VPMSPTVKAIHRMIMWIPKSTKLILIIWAVRHKAIVTGHPRAVMMIIMVMA
jgi:hypothetical protein